MFCRRQMLDNCEGGRKRQGEREEEVCLPKSKRTKAVQVEAEMQEELADKDGLEKNYIGSYLGRADVHLEQLSVSSKVTFPINPLKVEELERLMIQKFDISQISLTVVPVGLGSERLTAEKLSVTKYETIHGRHRLLALQEIEKKGLMNKLRGMERKLVTCHIMRADCPILANYGAARGNTCQAELVRKPFLHELVFVHEGLIKQFDKDKALEAVTRFGRSMAIGHDELAAIRKIGVWPSEVISSLVTVLHLYQTLQTEDVKIIAKRNASKIMNGHLIPVPNVLFKKLSKVDASYFYENAIDVVDKKKSLKQLVEDFSTVQSRVNIRACIKEISGFVSMEALDLEYPEKFSDEVLDMYAGAVIGVKGLNDKGKALQDYCQGTFEHKEVAPRATFKEVKEFSDVDVSKLEGYECVVINSSNFDKETVVQVQTLKSLKTNISIIILHSNQEDCVAAFNLLKHSTGMAPKLIFFLVESPTVKGNFCENVKFGVVLPGVVYKAPLLTLNGDLSRLEEVVTQIVPCDSNIAFVNDRGEKIVAVHSKHTCDYFGIKEDLGMFKNFLSSDMNITNDVDINENNAGVDEERAGKSSTGEICNSTLADADYGGIEESFNASNISAVVSDRNIIKMDSDTESEED